MMKKIISLLFLILFFGQTYLSDAQEDGKVKEAAEEAKQEVLNEKVAGKSQAEVESVLLEEFEKENKRLYPAHSKEVTPEKQMQLDQIIQVMDQAAPNSFSWNYAKYLNDNRSAEAVPNIKMAYSMEPNDTRVITEMAALGEIQGDKNVKKEFCQKLDDKNIYSAAEQEYNFNVLNSIEPGGYLITNGNVDTYPAWIEQEVYDNGKNKQVLNLDLLQNESYRSKTFKEIGIPALNGLQTSEEIVDHMVNHKSQGEIYFGLTVAHHILIKNSPNLYLTGLALVYDKSPDINYNDKMARSWEELFDKDHITDGQNINRNYLLLLKKLHDYYTSLGRNDEAVEVKNLVAKIVKNFGLRNPIE